MTSDFVNNLFPDAAQTDASAASDTSTGTETVDENAASDTGEQSEANGEPKAANTAEDQPFPKKAVNAISRRDKAIGKLQAERQQLQNELQQLREAQAKGDSPKKSDGRPKEEDFDNYGEYLKADMKYEALKEFQEQNQKQNIEQKQQQFAEKEQAYYAQREEAVFQQVAEFTKTIPDMKDIVIEHSDVLDEMSPQVQQAFLEADNAALAFYALAKEGKLESLIGMSPARAAMEIGRAEERGAAMIKTNTVTKAPAPMSANKGSASAGKTADNMSGDELLKAIKGR